MHLYYSPTKNLLNMYHDMSCIVSNSPPNSQQKQSNPSSCICFTFFFLIMHAVKKKQGRKKGLIWFHFIEGPMINSSHHEAKCKYCFEKMGSVSANMLQYFKEDCSKISEEIRDTLRNLDNRTKKISISILVSKLQIRTMMVI